MTAHTDNCNTYKGLLMGLMDNELTPEESQEVNSHLIRCAHCREEYHRLQHASDKLKGISFTEPQDRELEKLWKSPYSRFARNFSLIIILAGWLILLAFGIFEALRAPGEPLLPKMAIAAMILGFVVLLVSVIRERIKTYKTDPYKEVEK